MARPSTARRSSRRQSSNHTPQYTEDATDDTSQPTPPPHPPTTPTTLPNCKKSGQLRPPVSSSSSSVEFDDSSDTDDKVQSEEGSEADEESDEDGRPDRKRTTQKKRGIRVPQVGDPCKAKYTDGRYYLGVVAKHDKKSNTYTINFDDEDSLFAVPRDDIRLTLPADEDSVYAAVPYSKPPRSSTKSTSSRRSLAATAAASSSSRRKPPPPRASAPPPPPPPSPPAPVKKATTAYEFFRAATMPLIQAATPDLFGGQLSTEVSAQWHALDDAGKAEFNDLAADDKTRFQSESAAADAKTEAEQQKKREDRSSRPGASRDRSTIGDLNEEDDEMEFLDTDSDDGALDDSGSDSDDLRIEKILAVKNMTKAEWQKIMSVMNTAEVESGSMWFDGENEAVPSDTMFVERFLIKWQALSFVHVSWETREDLESQIGVQVKSQIKRFLGFKHFENKCFTQSERGDGEYFPLQFLEVDRVLDITDHNQNALDIPFTTEDRDLLPETLPKLAIATDKSNPKYEKNPGRRILIKWMDKGYSDSTYELERDLQLFNIEYDASTQLFLKRKRRMTQKAFNRTIDKHVDAIIAENKLYNFGHIADDEDSSLPSPDFHSKSADRQKTRAVNIANFEKRLEGREWKNGGSLRDYQAKGITWMYMQSLPKRIDKLSKEHEMNNRGVMLADEMGLGKTLQTITFLDLLRNERHCTKPFLIVAPLSTIPHWQREVQEWTDLNAVVYYGNAEDRKAIRELEFVYGLDMPATQSERITSLKRCHPSADKSNKSRPASIMKHSVTHLDEKVPEFMCVESIKMKGQGKTRYVNMPSTTSFERKLWMPDVVITTPETISTDDWMELSAVDWQCLVVDEAHKLKNVDSKLSQTLSRNEFNVDFKLTLTGTPLQNNTLELWSLLHFMDRLKFPLTAKKDAPGEIYSKERFEEQFHDADNTGKKLTMEGIHEIIGPYLLRRVKGDVEKTVPPKTETIIDCPMVMFQKMTYKAIYDRNMKLLASAELSAKQRKSKSKLNMPSLINVQMELRKCCNHTFLVAGAEQRYKTEILGIGSQDSHSQAELLSGACGKFRLLDKLLPKLKSGGHRVLIFSQFTMMLDVLQDYLDAHEMIYERIDGSVTGLQRQTAIDRYQGRGAHANDPNPPFVMLLSTRAGGVGINLTAADTCIIYDSDWNPQNDIQAQARCHRIGQTKPVNVYRLITRNSYEQQMFEVASQKMGLDEVVLHKSNKGGMISDDPVDALSADEVQKLLKQGVFGLFDGDPNDDSEDKAFANMDIDDILSGSKKIVHDDAGEQSKAGGAFSKVTFDTGAAIGDVDIDDPEFWQKTYGADRFLELTKEEELKARTKGKKTLNEGALWAQAMHGFESESDPEDGGGKRRKKAPDPKEAGSDEDSFYASTDEDDSDAEDKGVMMNFVPASGVGEGAAADDDDNRQRAKTWKPISRIKYESMLKQMQINGYGSWERMFTDPKLEGFASAPDGQETLQMMYRNMFLVLFKWGARHDAADVRKKMKMRNETPAPEFKDNDPILAAQFGNMWRGNSKWAIPVLLDVFAYGETDEGKELQARHAKRKNNEVVTYLHKHAQADFYRNLMPELERRGWGMLNGGMKIQAPPSVNNGTVFNNNLKSVLDTVEKMYSELLPVVTELRKRDEESRGADSLKRSPSPLPGGESEATKLIQPEYAYGKIVEAAAWHIPNCIRQEKSFTAKQGKKALVVLARIQALELSKMMYQDGDMPNLSWLPPGSESFDTNNHGWGRTHDLKLIKTMLTHGNFTESENQFKDFVSRQLHVEVFGAPYNGEKMGRDVECDDMRDAASERAAALVNSDQFGMLLRNNLCEMEIRRWYRLEFREGKWWAPTSEAEKARVEEERKQQGEKKVEAKEEGKEAANVGESVEVATMHDDVIIVETTTTATIAAAAAAAAPRPAPPAPEFPNRNWIMRRLTSLCTRYLGKHSLLTMQAQGNFLTTFEPRCPANALATLLLQCACRELNEKKFVLLLALATKELELGKANKTSLGAAELAVCVKEIRAAAAMFRSHALSSANKLRNLLGLSPIQAVQQFNQPMQIVNRPRSRPPPKVEAKKLNPTNGEASLQSAIGDLLRKQRKIASGKEVVVAEKDKEKPPIKLVQAEMIILESLIYLGIPVLPRSKQKKDGGGFMVSWLQIKKKATDQVEKNLMDAQRDKKMAWGMLESRKAQYGAIMATAGEHTRELQSLQTVIQVDMLHYDQCESTARAATATASLMNELCVESPPEHVPKDVDFVCASSLNFAKVALLLLQAVSETFDIQTKKQAKGKSSDGGLGSQVLAEAQGVKEKWMCILSLCDETVNTIGYKMYQYRKSTVHGRLLAQSALAAGSCVVYAEMNGKNSRNFFAQFAQQTMLRSVFFESSINEIANGMKKVIRDIQSAGDLWQQPTYWSAQCDLGLLSALMELGWDSVEEIYQSQRYQIATTHSRWAEKDKLTYQLPMVAAADGSMQVDTRVVQARLLVQTRAVIQIRANHLTRELCKHIVGVQQSQTNVAQAEARKLEEAKKLHEAAAKQQLLQQQLLQQQLLQQQQAANSQMAMMMGGTGGGESGGGEDKSVAGVVLQMSASAAGDAEVENKEPEQNKGGTKREGDGGAGGGLLASPPPAKKAKQSNTIEAFFVSPKQAKKEE